MKVCFLTPALSCPNTKQINKEALQRIMNLVPNADHIIYEQEFEPDDFVDDPRVKYIAGNPKRQGFVVPRNALLNWFYNSDYDYAIWRDGGDAIGKPSQNDFLTLVDALVNERIPKIPMIQTTIGIVIDADRMELKQQPDFFDKLTVMPSTNNNGELHFCAMLNYKKYYGAEPYISSKVGNFIGVPEDRYFILLIKKLYGCWCSPTVVSSRLGGLVKGSTWAPGKDVGVMGYPPINFPRLRDLIDDEIERNNYVTELYPNQQEVIKIDRVEPYKELIRPYQPRKKKPKPIVGELF